MVGVSKAANAQGTPLEAAIKQGLDTLSLDQTITFTKYVRLILPLDGFAFWVKASLVSQNTLYNVLSFNEAPLNPPYRNPPSAEEAETFEVTVNGSLHYATNIEQGEVENFSINTVIFTSEQKIDAFK